MRNLAFRDMRLPRLGAMRSGGFFPASLFAGGSIGDAFIPEREFTYTKSGGGVYERVTTTGDEVARLTGMVNGINLDQDTFAKRPIYTEGSGLAWLAFDGVGDFMAVADVSGMRQSIMTFFIGVDPLSLFASREDWFASGNSSSYASNNYIFGNSSSAFQTFGRTPASKVFQGSMTANTKVIVSARSDGTNINSRINGVAQTTAALTLGTNDTSGFTLGSSKSGVGSMNHAKMNMYGLIVRGSTSSAAEIASTEAYMAAKTGVVL